MTVSIAGLACGINPQDTARVKKTRGRGSTIHGKPTEIYRHIKHAGKNNAGKNKLLSVLCFDIFRHVAWFVLNTAPHYMRCLGSLLLVFRTQRYFSWAHQSPAAYDCGEIDSVGDIMI